MNTNPLAAATVETLTGYAQTVRVGRHTLTADEPLAQGGTDTGPTPDELLLAALGACTSITLSMYAQRKAWELGRVHVELKLVKAGDAVRIERDVSFDAPLTPEQRARLLDICEKTPVTKLIKGGTAIATRLGAAGE